MKLAIIQTLRIIAGSLSALLRGLDPQVRSDRKGGDWVTDASRSLASLSVDWQAWGTKGGLCWRATRDGLRHVPAGPPKSSALKNPLTPLPRDTHKPRFAAHRATIPAEYMSHSIQTKTTRETALSNRKPISRRAPSAGAGKNALFPSRSFTARGALGVAVGFGVGVHTTDSHALSNTWESVQKFGLHGNGVVI